MSKFLKRITKRPRNSPDQGATSTSLPEGLRPASPSTSPSVARASENVSSEHGAPADLPPKPNTTQPQDHQQQTAGQQKATPTPLKTAEARLKEAANKLQKVIPEQLLESDKLEIKGCADINPMADDVALAIGRLMDQRNVDEAKQSVVKTLMKGWVKKALPFIQYGLNSAKVGLSAASVLKLEALC
jgi:hypothetical protein